ncbi:MAG TPA: hypothetical protein VGQ93_07900 [Lysobacter sp.]|jgi:hypothetical protein|nr:hypothetical protein [Lysobacter sp.]
MNQPPCPNCGCTNAQGTAAHAIVAALAAGDLDQAIEAGLLTTTPCEGCRGDCRSALISARDARVGALAARERYRARQARLQRRAEERATARAAHAPAATSGPATSDLSKPALPSAAAAALERAKARAAERRKP